MATTLNAWATGWGKTNIKLKRLKLLIEMCSILNRLMWADPTPSRSSKILRGRETIQCWLDCHTDIKHLQPIQLAWNVTNRQLNILYVGEGKDKKMPKSDCTEWQNEFLLVWPGTLQWSRREPIVLSTHILRTLIWSSHRAGDHCPWNDTNDRNWKRTSGVLESKVK